MAKLFTLPVVAQSAFKLNVNVGTQRDSMLNVSVNVKVKHAL